MTALIQSARVAKQLIAFLTLALGFSLSMAPVMSTIRSGGLGLASQIALGAAAGFLVALLWSTAMHFVLPRTTRRISLWLFTAYTIVAVGGNLSLGLMKRPVPDYTAAVAGSTLTIVLVGWLLVKFWPSETMTGTEQ